MLQHLSILNYALITALEIDFPDGFSVMTGETGAGKSIILGALGLVMGQRADSKAITEGEQKCVIEAEFDLSGYGMENFFQEHDLDYDEQHCLIRRELSANGKSRSFVNDTPIALTDLKELTGKLIDIHSQHENLQLESDRFQLQIIDTVAANASILTAYKKQYHTYKTLAQQLDVLKVKAAAERADADYIAFQYKQLSEAQLQPDELAELETEQNILTHAEDIKNALSVSNNLLNGAEEIGILGMLKECNTALRQISGYQPQAGELDERLQSTYIELKDIANEISRIYENTDYDPQRQQIVEERLDTLNTLLQKHHVSTVQELITLCREFDNQLQHIASFDDEIAALEKETATAQKELAQATDKLTASRKAVKTSIEQRLTEQLHLLGIPHPQFEISFGRLSHYAENGIDDVQFLFAANKNQSLKNVSQVASGGEISRLMLCIKALIADKQALPTIIFDEIDTGVSGEIADKMGEIMRQMAQNRQVISITHLPQIAAKGTQHYKVYKTDSEKRTETNIKRLTDSERVQEIAQMLSGTTISEAAIENAKTLLTH